VINKKTLIIAASSLFMVTGTVDCRAERVLTQAEASAIHGGFNLSCYVKRCDGSGDGCTDSSGNNAGAPFCCDYRHHEYTFCKTHLEFHTSGSSNLCPTDAPHVYCDVVYYKRYPGKDCAHGIDMAIFTPVYCEQNYNSCNGDQLTSQCPAAVPVDPAGGH